MTKTIYTPFTYLIGWASFDRWYYGVRFARGCHPDDLWTKYFTSSKVVQEFREEHGDPDIIEVRQTFPTDTLARSWEHKVLRRLDVIHNDRWLNKANGRAIPPQFGRTHSESTKQKISAGNKGKTFSEESKAKMSAAKMGNTNRNGKTCSEESKAKMGAMRKGKPISEETKVKISDAKKRKT